MAVVGDTVAVVTDGNGVTFVCTAAATLSATPAVVSSSVSSDFLELVVGFFSERVLSFPDRFLASCFFSEAACVPPFMLAVAFAKRVSSISRAALSRRFISISIASSTSLWILDCFM